MRQSLASDPFIAKVISPIITPPLVGRWAAVRGLPPEVVRVIAALAAGTLGLEYSPIAPHDPTLVLTAGPVRISHRTRSNLVFNTGINKQEPATLALFAAYLALSGKSGFPAAYARLLAGMADGKPQPELDLLMAAVGRALVAGCRGTIITDKARSASGNEVVWFYAVRPDDATPELFASGGLKLAGLLADPVRFAAYRAGRLPAFASMKAAFALA
jgi:hypothetical protein